MIGITSIATELQESIFRALESSKDRASVARTCRVFNNIIEPILYSTFSQTGANATALLLLKLIEYPHLAERFKKFSATEPEQAKDSWHAKQINSFHVESHVSQWLHSAPQWLTAHYKACRELDLQEGWMSPTTTLKSFMNVWKHSLLGDKNWDAMTATLLLLLPNLEEIEILASHERRMSNIGGVLRIAGKIQSTHSTAFNFSFPKLSSLSVRMINSINNERIRPGITKITPLLKISSLRSLDCDNLEYENDDYLQLTHPLHIENLRITNCQLKAKAVSALIKNCPSLRHLSLEFDPRLPVRSPHQTNAIFQSLRPVKDRLESLSMIYTCKISTYYHNHKRDNFSLASNMGILGFSNIHTLDIDTNDSFDRRILTGLEDDELTDSPSRAFALADFPAALVRVIVRNVSRSTVLSQSYELATLPPDVLPQLKSVSMLLRWQTIPEGDQRLLLDTSKRLWVKRGVKLCFRLQEIDSSVERVIEYSPLTGEGIA